MNKENYHKYIFDKRKRSFIGELDRMHATEQNEYFNY